MPKSRKTKSAYQNPGALGRKQVIFLNNCHSVALKGAKKSKNKIAYQNPGPIGSKKVTF